MSSNDSNPPTPPPTDPPADAPPPADDTLAEPLPPPPMPGGAEAGAPPPVTPPLQREAVVLVHDRGRLALLVSLASLAGVALGFTLALLAFRGDMRRQPAVVGPVAMGHEPCELRGMHPFWEPNGIDVWHHDSHTWLGVGLEDAGGKVRVTGVFPGSPAERAGLMKGDIIRTLDGEAVATPSQVKRAVQAHDGGDRVKIEVERNGVGVTVTATLGERGGHSGARIRIR